MTCRATPDEPAVEQGAPAMLDDDVIDRVRLGVANDLFERTAGGDMETMPVPGCRPVWISRVGAPDRNVAVRSR